MIQVKSSIHNQVGFLWMPVHINLAPQSLEDNPRYLEAIIFFLPKRLIHYFSNATASEYSIIFKAGCFLPLTKTAMFIQYSMP